MRPAGPSGMGGWAWQKLHEPAGAGVGILIVRPVPLERDVDWSFERLRRVEVAGGIRQQANLDAAGVAQRDRDAFDSLVGRGIEPFVDGSARSPVGSVGLGRPGSGSRRPGSSNPDA